MECTGKSILLRQAAESRHTEFVPVEGSAGLTPARLIGSLDPALVLEQGYRPESFSGGPLVPGGPSPARWRRPRLWASCWTRSLR